jgi:tripartite-type tricarboxylate transporter receptor subunit TctC
MRLWCRCSASVIGSSLLLVGASGVVHAQTYPNSPVRIIVPFPAGGGVDGMGRILAQKLTESFGKSFVIENRGGANGNIGTEVAAKSAKDGYTLLVTGAGLVTNPSLYAKVPYDAVKDLDPISLAAMAPNILVVHPSVPARTVKELIALARARPGEVQYGGSGSGSTPHLAAELFKTMAHIDIVHIPYRGTGPALVGLLSGEANIMFLPVTSGVPLVKSGRLRALAVTSTKRLQVVPQVPTVAESGLKGYESSQWYGMLAPAGTPADILTVLNTHVVKCMQSPDVKQRLLDEGAVPIGSTREEFASHIRAELAKWAKVIKESGARID